MPPQLRQYQPIDFGIRIPQNVFTTPANTNIFYDALDAQNQRTINDAKVAEVEQAMQLNRDLKDIFAPVDGVAPDFETKRQDVMNALARSGQINQVIAMQEEDRRRQDLYGDQAAQVISSAARIAPFSPETAISILNNAKAKGVIDPNISIDEILLRANRYGMTGFDSQNNARQVVQPIVLPGSGGQVAKEEKQVRLYDQSYGNSIVLSPEMANYLEATFPDIYTRNRADLSDEVKSAPDKAKQIGRQRYEGIVNSQQQIVPEKEKVSVPKKVSVQGPAAVPAPAPTPSIDEQIGKLNPEQKRKFDEYYKSLR